MSALPVRTAPDSSAAPPDGSTAAVVTRNASFRDLLKLATYHREEKEKRRTLAMQVFIGLIAVDLLLARGATEVAPRVTDVDTFRWGMRALFVALFVIFALFMLRLERAIKVNADQCDPLERYLWGLAGGTVEGYPAEGLHKLKSKQPTFWESVLGTWMGACALLAAAVFALMGWVLVGILKPS
jgi:hypothetical protein